MRQAQAMIDSAIYGIAWAAIVMLFDYSMWQGNAMEWYYDALALVPAWIGKPLGLCQPCSCLWFGIPFSEIFDVKNYFIFLGFSQLVIISYKLVLLFYFSQKK